MNFKDTINLEKELVPKFAIIGYEVRPDDYYEGGETMAYFEFREIKNGKLLSGEPLTKATANGIFSSLGKDINPYSFKGLMPSKVLHFNVSTKLEISWVFHPKTKYLYFKDDLEIKSGRYALPKLIFTLKGETLSVHAINKNHTISESTKLFHAPFFNVYDSGDVCLGNTSLDYSHLSYYEEIIEFIEKQFFNSIFTHPSHNNLCTSNIFDLYAKMYESNKFDSYSELTQKDITIKNLYK